MKKTKIVALVPMRHHSERVKHKNYRSFNGRPLFYWILKTLSKCLSIDSIYINTDSPVIKEKAPKISRRIHVIDRPENLRGDTVPMNDILLYDVQHVQADYYLQTHSTNPLLKSGTVERAIRLFLKSPRHDSLFAVTRFQTRLWDQDAKAMNHNPKRLERTQDLPPVYEENSNLYMFTKENLEKYKNRIGRKPLMFEVNKYEALDIDEEVDFQAAEVLMKARRKRL